MRNTAEGGTEQMATNTENCKPSDCPVFGKGCTPQHPVGACMVSGEGACSAYYQYGGDLL